MGATRALSPLRLQRALGLSLSFLAAPVFATTHHVRADGSGDYLTVEGAVSAAAAGDTIEIGPGTYQPASSISIGVPLVFISTDGPASTVIDGRDTIRLFIVNAGPVTFTGLCFTRSTASAVRLFDPGVFSDCVFLRNERCISPVATDLTVEACTFRENQWCIDQVGSSSGACNYTVSNSVFVGSTNLVIYIDRGNLEVTGSLFYLNYSRAIDASTYSPGDLSGEIAGNTFDANGTAISIWDDTDMSVHNNVIVNSVDYGIWFYVQASAPHDCNVFWNNTRAHVYRGSLSPNEIVADPLFCERYADYSLASNSPALPQNNSCGLVGAFPMGCVAAQPDVPKIILVMKDGSGDFDEVRDAVDAANPLDTVVVGDGSYLGGIVGFKSIVIRSLNGPSVTTLDGSNTSRILHVAGPVSITLQGLSLINGFANTGGAVQLDGVALARIRNCSFEHNRSTSSGGAIMGSGQVEVDRCHFFDNQSPSWGGAIRHQGNLAVTRSEFIQNQAEEGGAVQFQGDRLDVSESLFVENVATGGAAAIHERLNSPFPGGPRATIKNNTFHANQSMAQRATVWIECDGSCPTHVDQNIFSGELAGFAVLANSHECNVFWNNAAGSIYGGGPLAPNEMVADPLFCEPAAGDFSVSTASPAAAAQSPCGLLIGAYPPSCTFLATLIKEFRVEPRDGNVHLSWDIVSDDVVLGFQFERGDESGEKRILPDEPLSFSVREFVDESARPGTTYTYTLVVIRDEGPFVSAPETVTTPALRSSLLQNTPNPFNPMTRIAYTVGEPATIVLTVFDVRGAHVRTLVSKFEEAGSRFVTWDGRDDRGAIVSSGIYFYRLRAGTFTATKKMVLVR